MAKSINVAINGQRGASIQVPREGDWELNFNVFDADGVRLPFSAATAEFYTTNNRTGAPAFTKPVAPVALQDGQGLMTIPDTDTDFAIGTTYYLYLVVTEVGGDISVASTPAAITAY